MRPDGALLTEGPDEGWTLTDGTDEGSTLTEGTEEGADETLGDALGAGTTFDEGVGRGVDGSTGCPVATHSHTSKTLAPGTVVFVPGIWLQTAGEKNSPVDPSN